MPNNEKSQATNNDSDQELEKELLWIRDGFRNLRTQVSALRFQIHKNTRGRGGLLNYNADLGDAEDMEPKALVLKH